MQRATQHAATLDLTDKAAHFEGPSIPSPLFHRQIRDGYPWLNASAPLLRSAHVLLEQCEQDSRRSASGGPAPFQRSLHLVAVMNAALAVESALKGAILCAEPWLPSRKSTGKEERTPRYASGHNLAALAKRAGFAPATEHERNAVEHGEKDISWQGRYPATLLSSQWSGFSMTNPIPLVAAFTSIFFKLVEEISRREFLCGRGGDSRGKTQDDYAAAEVASYKAIVAI